MSYDHTQRGYFHWLLVIPALASFAWAAWMARSAPPTAVMSALGGVVLLLSGVMFGHLTVRDEGPWLALRFGPLPLLRKRIPYAGIVAAEPDRVHLLDGWGIHWIPGRGWTYNVWGFHTVRLTLRSGGVLRVGTNQPEELAAFLRSKIGDIPLSSPGK